MLKSYLLEVFYFYKLGKFLVFTHVFDKLISFSTDDKYYFYYLLKNL